MTGVYSYRTGPGNTLTALDYFYRSASTLGDLNRPSFSVQIDHWTSPADDPTPHDGKLGGTPQAITVTVTGQTLPATYTEDVANEGQIWHLTFTQGTTQVWLTAAGLSKDQFFAAVNALVDSKTNPAVVAQLQGELNAAGTSAPGAP